MVFLSRGFGSLPDCVLEDRLMFVACEGFVHLSEKAKSFMGILLVSAAACPLRLGEGCAVDGELKFIE